MKRFTLLFAGMIAASLLCACVPDVPESVRTAGALARRIIPAQASRIVFREIPSDSCDVFTVASEGRKIVIEGNNAGSMASGLNYYLTNCCKTVVSCYAHHPVDMPAVLPAVGEKVTVRARDKYRFYLNYCTFGYTMPWWGWKEWERFIDWMALNGVNLPLAVTGEEATWQKVWRKFGLTDDEIRAYFPGPAYLPWHRMCNLDSFNGPLPQKWIDRQAELQKKILAREREFAMKPVLQAFGGHVPGRLAELRPDARISRCRMWGGFAEQYHPWFLDPADPLFEEIQKEYIKQQTEEFGTDHIYGLDPFNEMDPPTWDAAVLAGMGRDFQKSLEAADPDAIWLQMGWFLINDRVHWTDERMEAFLGSVPRGKMILLDYHVDWVQGWELTNNFYGHDYIACTLLNFGGNTLLNGRVRNLSGNLDRCREQGGPNLVGVGSTLEGFGTNPYYHAFFVNRTWDPCPDVDAWIDSFADTHAGFSDTLNLRLWKEIIDDVAPQYTGSGVSANGHPKLGGWWRWTVKYPDIKGVTPTMRIWREMLEVPSSTEAWKYDLVNLGRQALGDQFDIYKDSLEAAFARRDADAVRAVKEQMREVLEDTDELLACIPEFCLRNWIEAARSWGDTPEEKDYYEHNARMILTVWGDSFSLTDYANRQWSGLVSNYYEPRWLMFCDVLLDCIAEGRELDQTVVDARCREMELRFVDVKATPLQYKEAGDPVEVSRRLVEKYGF